MKNPCTRGCPDRCETCHTTCENYIAWRKEVDDARASETVNIEVNQQFIGMEIKRRIKWLKRQRRH